VRFHDRWLKRRGGTSHLVVPFEPAFGATEADRCCERGVERAELVQRLRPFRSVHARCASGALRSPRRAGCGCFDGKRSRAHRPSLRREGFKEKKHTKRVPAEKAKHTTWLRPRLVGEVKFTEWRTAAKCATRSFWACAVNPRNAGMRVPDHMPCSTRTRPANRPTTAFALRWHPAHRLGRYDGGLAELLAAALAVAALAWFAGPQ
jgi:hypothetical protein